MGRRMRSLLSPLAGCEVLRGHPQHMCQELLRVTRAGDDRTRGIGCQMLIEVLGENETIQGSLLVRREEVREGTLEENHSFKEQELMTTR